MAIVQKNIIGIDIGTENLKMVKVNSKGRVTHYTFIDLPEKIIINGRVESKQMLTETLKIARRKLGVNFTDCALCFDCPDTVIRQVTIPQMQEEFIMKNIMLELSGFLPMNPERYVIDYIITNAVETEGQKLFQIQVYAIPSEIVQVYADCVKAAGLKLRYVDIMENAYEKLYRRLRDRDYIRDEHFACLYIDHAKASVSLYGKGKLFINKVIDASVDKIIENISERTGKSLDVVKRNLYTTDVMDSMELYAVEKGVIENFAKELSFEIQRVIEYFKSRNEGAGISAVFFSGEFSHVKGIQSSCEKALGIPVIPASRYLDPIYDNVPAKDNGIDYTNAIAITLREESAR